VRGRRRPRGPPRAAGAVDQSGAERNGRVNLINPKKTMELAGIKL
jgi:hypothetical protein